MCSRERLRIHDLDNDTSVSSAAIYLTISEAAQLLGNLHDLINRRAVSHFRINDAEFQRELHFYKYDPHVPIGFDARQKRLIEEDI